MVKIVELEDGFDLFNKNGMTAGRGFQNAFL